MYFIISTQTFAIPLFAGAAVSASVLIGLVFGLILKNCVKNSYAVFLALFYFLVVLILVMLPVGKIVEGEPAIITPENNVSFKLDLFRPFKHPIYMQDFLLNLFMLAPFGFAMGFVLPKKFWVCVGICVLAAFLLETMQLFSKSRVTDINDFLYNFGGAITGLAVSRLALYLER